MIILPFLITLHKIILHKTFRFVYVVILTNLFTLVIMYFNKIAIKTLVFLPVFCSSLTIFQHYDDAFLYFFDDLTNIILASVV